MTDRLDIADVRREMIKVYLRWRGFRFLIDQDGDLIVRFRCRGVIVDYLLVAEPNGKIISFKTYTDMSFEIEKIPLVLIVINQFQRANRWPRLTVATRDDAAFIVAEGHLLMEDSVDQGEVNRFLDCGLMATNQCWEEFELPDVGSAEAQIVEFLRDHREGAA